ncbi:hypothetical protein LX16_3033 [Stackebrandtia albiflava]|uniref:Uncharacterized protein n=1 Tax=Stackebrandtia albiflava TaxID=406432 RepID=A0A562V394_9ACTN|nr:hypothetical protein [Stackebrandtia albiflava]TWJ12277.1 hypothetical protein LX16_3033 [Stackebrandtia albiflava]
MSVTVTPDQLDGYAGQIRANAGSALQTMQEYRNAHCVDYTGLTGLLHLLRVPLGVMSDWGSQLMTAAADKLWLTADNLAGTAQSYRDLDLAAADELWRTVFDAPADHRETDADSPATGYTRGAVITLAVPAPRSDSVEMVNNVYSALELPNRIATWVLGWNPLEKGVPWAIGEFGQLYRIGEAWNELEHAFIAIGTDLTTGMDTLSVHWDSSESGDSGASAAFDHHIRESWVPAMNACGQLCDLFQQLCEQMAAAFQEMVHELLFILNFYGRKIKAAAKVLTELTSLSFKAVWNIKKLVSALYHAVVDLYELTVLKIEMFVECAETLVAAGVALRNHIRGDFEVMQSS